MSMDLNQTEQLDENGAYVVSKSPHGATAHTLSSIKQLNLHQPVYSVEFISN